MMKRTNSSVHWAVVRDVDWDVGDAVRRTMDRDVRGTVRRTMDRDVDRAIEVAVDRAVWQEPAHPAIQDFLRSCGARVA